MLKCCLYTLIFLGAVRTILCQEEQEMILKQIERAISDQLIFGRRLGERRDRSVETINNKIAVANNNLAGLYNHSLTIFSGQVEYVQSMLKNALDKLETNKKNETKKLKKYKKLLKDLNTAIEKNNAACRRVTPIYQTDRSLETLFQTLKESLLLFLTMQDHGCPKYKSDVTTCQAVQSLPSSCTQTRPGIRKLSLEGTVYEVLCEEGGWTVLMSRLWPNGKEFYEEREHGNLCSEFLLDKEPIIRLLRKEPYVLHLETEEPKVVSTFEEMDFRPNDTNKQDYVLTARGIKVYNSKNSMNFKESDEFELAVTWIPFSSNTNYISKIKIRPATLGLP